MKFIILGQRFSTGGMQEDLRGYGKKNGYGGKNKV